MLVVRHWYCIDMELFWLKTFRPILHKYANEDVSLGAWFIGLEVEHIDERNMCCGTPPGMIFWRFFQYSFISKNSDNAKEGKRIWIRPHRSPNLSKTSDGSSIHIISSDSCPYPHFPGSFSGVYLLLILQIVSGRPRQGTYVLPPLTGAAVAFANQWKSWNSCMNNVEKERMPFGMLCCDLPLGRSWS